MSHFVFVESTRPGLRALEVAKELGHHTTFVTGHKMDWMLNDADQARLARNADVLIEVADSHDADVLTAAFTAHQAKHPVDAVLSTFHPFCEPAATAAHRLGLRAVSAQGVFNARDKGRCREILDRQQIPSVRHRVVRSAAETLEALREVGYPAILKPTTGLGKVLTTLLHDEAQVIEHFANAERNHQELRVGFKEEVTLEFVLEEFALGPLYSLEIGVTAQGEPVPFAILKRKVGKHNPVLELGSTMPSDLSDAQYELAAGYGARIVKALGLDLGIFHIEFIYTANGPRLVEVNPRIAGGAIPDLIRAATGADLFEYLIRIYNGERLGLRQLPCRSAASHTFIAAQKDCVVRADLPAAWFEPFKAQIASGSVDVVAGQALRRMDGNYDLYGVVRVTAEDYPTAVRRTEELRLAVQAELGVQLVEVVD
jgi:biotin carboxylase